MSDLPIETWENIIEFVRAGSGKRLLAKANRCVLQLPSADKATFCQLSKLFNAIATKILYRHVSLYVEFTSVISYQDEYVIWKTALETIILNDRRQADAVRILELNCVFYGLSCTPLSTPKWEPYVDDEVNELIALAVSEMSRLDEFIWLSNLPLREEIMYILASRPITKFTFHDYPNICGQSSIAPLIRCPLTSLSIDANIIEDDNEFKTLFWSIRRTLRHLRLWNGVHARRTEVFEPLVASGRKLDLISLGCVGMNVLDIREVIEAVNLQTLRKLNWVPKDSPDGQLLWTYLRKAPVPMSLKSLTTDKGDETLAEFLRSFAGLETLLLGDWGCSVIFNLELSLASHCWSLRYLRLPHECELGKAYLDPRTLQWLMVNCVNLEELSCAMNPEEMVSPRLF
ncbi:hypothetical protein VTN77DRAFT_272 [Rasamsonia byssochlamydoides]|uniref:uncharacterized protein n=1 Tax=Rasamsonia byssochlamydoides TaxID=89139 RepID=UPI0037438A8F